MGFVWGCAVKWMTKTEVERAAKKGPLAALDNCIEKYTQMLKAPAKALRAKFERTSIDYIWCHYCACCIHVGRDRHGVTQCGKCPIWAHGETHCSKQGWGNTRTAIHGLIDGGPIAPVRQAIRELIRNMKKARKIMVSK